MENFKLFGYVPAMARREKVLEVCRAKGWKFLCMQPGRRYVIKVGINEYYWTLDEVIEKGRVANGANSLDSLQVGGNSLLDSRFDNKVSVVRNPRSI